MIVRELFERDAASASLGMTLVESGSGHAVVAMPVREDMLNGFGVMHGGFVFALADTAFAMACNDGKAVTVTSGADITFLRSVGSGQSLIAVADERSTSGRSGIYDVTVRDETDKTVAEFRGRSRTTDRTSLADV
ncbi:MAG: hydroxyphenylacetyl-CoA thioesterase PaaI [Actinomycetota bacterium]|jgi:acyl-CoA thioesterase